MAPVNNLSDEPAQTKAKEALVAIHPNLRAKIVDMLPRDEWLAMSFVEKLNAVQERLPSFDGILTDFERGAAKTSAEQGPTILGVSMSSPGLDESPDPAKGNEAPLTKDDSAKAEARAKLFQGRCPYGMDKGCWVVSEEELRLYDTADACWISIDCQVFDVSEWIQSHPGGAASILKFAGGDATDAFNGKGHSNHAWSLLKQYHVGSLAGNVQRFDDFLAANGVKTAGKVDACNIQHIRSMLELDVEQKPPQDVEGLAAFELRAIHPSVREKIFEGLDQDGLRMMSFAQKLDYARKHMPQGEVVDETCPISGKKGQCPMQQMQKGGQTPAADTCPISGKTGECPMQQMQKASQVTAAGTVNGKGEHVPTAANKAKGIGKGTGEDCSIM